MKISDLRRELSVRNCRVATHIKPDLDALLSVALWAHLIGMNVRDLILSFIPSGSPVPEGFVGLDISAGFKGLNSSCFEELLELATPADRAALGLLGAHATKQDQGEVHRLPRELSIGFFGNCLSTFRKAGWTDQNLVLLGADLFMGALLQGRDRVAAVAALETAEWHLERRVVLLPSGSGMSVTMAAFEVGAEIAIYEDGANVGVVRTNDGTLHLGELLQGLEELTEFFFHPSGRFVSRGTQKSPAATLGTVNGRRLLELVLQRLAEKGL